MESSIHEPASLHSVKSHRSDRESGFIVYPVLSRRSGGLSLGINLFPERKLCNFDCPYCEIFPISEGMPAFSLEKLEAELEAFVKHDYPGLWSGFPVRDICLSGNGEPTISPQFEASLRLIADFRRRWPQQLGKAKLVLITNSTSFADPRLYDLLAHFIKEEGLEIWAKLDAGGQALFELMSGTNNSLKDILASITRFARQNPIVIQTMLCEALGHLTSAADVAEYSLVLEEMLKAKAQISEVHLYTFARPSPSGLCAPLSDGELLAFSEIVHGRTQLRVRAFGASGELPGFSNKDYP